MRRTSDDSISSSTDEAGEEVHRLGRVTKTTTMFITTSINIEKTEEIVRRKLRQSRRVVQVRKCILKEDRAARETGLQSESAYMLQALGTGSVCRFKCCRREVAAWKAIETAAEKG